MAKTKRIRLGSILKGKQETDKEGKPLTTKDGKPIMKRDCIKINIVDKTGKPGSYVLNHGQYLNLESKADQLKDLDFLVKNGKIDEDTEKYLREKIEKIPDFVRFEIVAIEAK